MKENFRSDISVVKGHGSAKNGTSHFIHQRVTAIALVPLCIWFVISIIVLLQNPKEVIPEYVISPINITFIVLFTCTAIYHGVLGLRVVIEDYIHCNFVKYSALIVLYFVSITTVVCGLISILGMHIIFRLIG